MIARPYFIALTSGMLTGFLAALVGVGGAELRYPFLLYALKIPMREVIILNLGLSFLTSSWNFYLRLTSGLINEIGIKVGLSMMFGSLLGVYVGSIISHKVSENMLRYFLATILIIVVIRLVMEMVMPVNAYDLSLVFPYSMAMAILLGFLIGIISGIVGVAGGEYRIPALTFILGIPIIISGTVSQMVSIPTVLLGIVKHLTVLKPHKIPTVVATIMGIGSILGVFLATDILMGERAEDVVKIVFVLILTYTIARLFKG